MCSKILVIQHKFCLYRYYRYGYISTNTDTNSNIVAPLILTTKIWRYSQRNVPNSVKLLSIILIATLCSLVWPDPTVLFLCVGTRITPSPHKSRKKQSDHMRLYSVSVVRISYFMLLNKSYPTSGLYQTTLYLWQLLTNHQFN